MNGIQKIAAERTRQIEDEKWTPEHDATEHASDNALLMAANSYLAHAIGRAWVYNSGDKQNYRKQKAPFCWPDGWKWKPKSPEKDLIRAGALIAAHLDIIGGLDSQNAQAHPPADNSTPTTQNDE